MITDFRKIDSLSPSGFEIFVRDVFLYRNPKFFNATVAK